MRILGIDPGTATTGWGVIEADKKHFVVDSWGLIETDKESKVEDRLGKIYKDTLSVLKKCTPDVFVFEKILP